MISLIKRQFDYTCRNFGADIDLCFGSDFPRSIDDFDEFTGLNGFNANFCDLFGFFLGFGFDRSDDGQTDDKPDDAYNNDLLLLDFSNA